MPTDKENSMEEEAEIIECEQCGVELGTDGNLVTVERASFAGPGWEVDLCPVCSGEVI